MKGSGRNHKWMELENSLTPLEGYIKVNLRGIFSSKKRLSLILLMMRKE
jgi:hypothetical protein